MTYLISAAFFVGFFLESVFGMAGTIISFSLLAYWIDIKVLVFVGVFVSMVCGTAVVWTGRRDISWPLFWKITLWALPGMIVGAFLLHVIDSLLLLKIFSVFLIVYALKGLFLKPFVLKGWIQRLMIFLSGFMTGLMGTGGPFAIVGMRHEFPRKEVLRSTIGLYFFVFAILRGFQYYVQGTFDFTHVKLYWPAFLSVIFAVFIGYEVHKRMSEKHFEKGLFILLLLAGAVFLLK